jgi:phosphomevalonate kinase
VSCPGKVLIVGGYLVLQEGTPGLVVSTSARFHSSLEWCTRGADAPPPQQQAPPATLPLLVDSPQFHARWTYHLRLAPPFTLSPADPARRNPYVECAVEAALAAAHASLLQDGGDGAVADTAGGLGVRLRAGAQRGNILRLRLAADNDFYSQRAHLLERGLPVCSASLASLPRFLPCPLDAATGRAAVSKTGLGSSAALVTSVVGAVLALLGGVVLPAPPSGAVEPGSGESAAMGGAGDDAGAVVAAAEMTAVTAEQPLSSDGGGECDGGPLLVHDVAQVAHGLAQGKIGSGFDVCSAALGSVRFR